MSHGGKDTVPGFSEKGYDLVAPHCGKAVQKVFRGVSRFQIIEQGVHRNASAADFKEFLQLLNKHDVKCLVIGGYVVGY